MWGQRVSNVVLSTQYPCTVAVYFDRRYNCHERYERRKLEESNDRRTQLCTVTICLILLRAKNVQKCIDFHEMKA
jgi:hypothetical protein